MEILPFLLAPFLASLILTGIHAYLGVHVVERGVIFVDLALAQIAALGATTAILIGMDPHGGGAYWLSLGFTFVGAGIFALARTRRGHVPQEAFIGIAYAVASAAAILAMSKATGETAPNVQTIVAPVGKSSATEKYTPNAETSVPIVQPIANRFPMWSANSIAPTDGTTR